MQPPKKKKNRKNLKTIFEVSSFRLAFSCGLMAISSILTGYLITVFAFSIHLVGLAVALFLAVGQIVLIVFFNYRAVVKPMRNMIKASKKITKGEFVRQEKRLFDSDLRDLTDSLNETAHEFVNLEQMRKSFISNASHELRSPLTSIQGFLQAILDGTIPQEEYERYLKIVFRETKRLSGLINSMLDLSRMESGKNPLSLNRFEVNSAIKQVVERFEPSLLKKEIQVNVDFAKETCFVFADKEKMVQVLINLIDNAIKYSPPRSRILVTTHLHGKKVYVSIKDSGFGISKKDQMLIWDRFFMADKAHTPTKNKGTGLGLSIVKKIIEDHNEVIWVESSKGSGSTFIFTMTTFDANKHKPEETLAQIITRQELV